MLRRRDAEAARSRPVDREIDGLAAVSEIAGDVGELGPRVQGLDEARHPGRECGDVGVLDDEMVLRARDRRVDRQVLHRLHVEADAGHRRDGLAQLGDDGRDAAPRVSSGFNVMKTRPVFGVELF